MIDVTEVPIRTFPVYLRRGMELRIIGERCYMVHPETELMMARRQAE